MPTPEGEAMSDSPPPPARPTKEQLKGALKAFKRRLRLTRLSAAPGDRLRLDGDPQMEG
jgi:hypothetical protein